MKRLKQNSSVRAKNNYMTFKLFFGEWLDAIYLYAKAYYVLRKLTKSYKRCFFTERLDDIYLNAKAFYVLRKLTKFCHVQNHWFIPDTCVFQVCWCSLIWKSVFDRTAWLCTTTVWVLFDFFHLWWPCLFPFCLYLFTTLRSRRYIHIYIYGIHLSIFSICDPFSSPLGLFRFLHTPH